MNAEHVAVLIVGAGPVGMATGALLRQHGIDVRIIERNSGPTPYSKAVGIHARTLESVHALRLADQLIADGHPMHRFRLTEAGKPIMSAGFQHIDSAYNFVLGLPQSRTERRLLDRLRELGGDVEWGTQLLDVGQCSDPVLPDQPVLARVKPQGSPEKFISCNWIIGADGSRSAVRELAGIDFPGGDYGNAFILGDVKIDWDGPKYDLQFFLSKNGYLLLVPMPDGMHRVIAQTDKRYEDFQVKGERPVTTLEELQAIADRTGPGNLKVHSPQWLTCAPFYHRLATTSVKGRIVLAGDSFHLFSPLGAQGLNTGFQDAFNLAWKLAFVEKGWAGAELIETYRSERESIARLVASVTSRTTRFITATSFPKRLLRRQATRIANRTAQVQEQMPRLLAGLLQSYGTASVLSGSSGLPAAPAGARIPHAWLPDGAGMRPLASLIHGTKFSLILPKNRLDREAIASIERFCSGVLDRLPFLRVVVVTRETASLDYALPAGCELVDDRLGSAFNALNRYDEAMVLARPDGYCAMSSGTWNLDQVAHYFAGRRIAIPLARTNDSLQKGCSHVA